MPKKSILIYILHLYIVRNYVYFFLFKKIKHILFNDTNNVTNIISDNINSYLFEWHKKYGIITKFVIKYNWKRKNQLFWYYLCYCLSLLKLFLLFKYLTSLLYNDTNLYSCYTNKRHWVNIVFEKKNIFYILNIFSVQKIFETFFYLLC